MAYESSTFFFFTSLVLLTVLKEFGGQRNRMVLEDAAEMLDRVIRQRLDLRMVFDEFQENFLLGFDAKSLSDFFGDDELSLRGYFNHGHCLTYRLEVLLFSKSISYVN